MWVYTYWRWEVIAKAKDARTTWWFSRKSLSGEETIPREEWEELWCCGWEEEPGGYKLSANYDLMVSAIEKRFSSASSSTTTSCGQRRITLSDNYWMEMQYGLKSRWIRDQPVKPSRWLKISRHMRDHCNYMEGGQHNNQMRSRTAIPQLAATAEDVPGADKEWSRVGFVRHRALWRTHPGTSLLTQLDRLKELHYCKWRPTLWIKFRKEDADGAFQVWRDWHRLEIQKRTRPSLMWRMTTETKRMGKELPTSIFRMKMEKMSRKKLNVVSRQPLTRDNFGKCSSPGVSKPFQWPSTLTTASQLSLCSTSAAVE